MAPVPGWPPSVGSSVAVGDALGAWRGALPIYLFFIFGPALAGAGMAAVFVSEFGADAKRGFHADGLTRFSEEYQADVYRRTLPMLEKIAGFSGCTPWILCDFRSPRRTLPGVQDGFTRKGLLDPSGKKKAAFDVLRHFYEEKAKER